MIYVETVILAGLAQVWEATQVPCSHQRWDLRFHEITQASGATCQPQRFRYSVRVLPGLVIAGHGISAGERSRPDGISTSALRFASPHWLSPIRCGAGYWRYLPCDEGIRFLTGYDYQPGWGRVGPAADLLFRPLLGWATAWSFDRLRLWLETGRSPEHLFRRAMLELLARIAAGGAALLPSIPPAVTAAVVSAAVLVPPRRGTPAARRCRRRPRRAAGRGQPRPSLRWSRHALHLPTRPRP